MTKIEKILYCVCLYYDISLPELETKSRDTRYSYTRRMAMYFLKKEKMTQGHIASILGMNNSSIVSYHLKTLNGLISVNDKGILEEIRTIEYMLQDPIEHKTIRLCNRNVDVLFQIMDGKFILKDVKCDGVASLVIELTGQSGDFVEAIKKEIINNK